MSLLLDALKKAERDKLKAREAEAGSGESNEHAVEPDTASSDSAKSVNVPAESPEELLSIEESDGELELVLDEPVDTSDEVEQGSLEEPDMQAEEPPLKPPIAPEKSAATTSTVSDEALQLLVYKTNKRYRRRQKVLWGGLLATTVVILMLAGSYYYFGVLEEVDALERKHQLAMRDVRSEPVKQNAEVAAREKAKTTANVNRATQDVIKTRQPASKQVSRAAQAAVKKKSPEYNVSFSKTKTEDPINTLLQDAWLAYNRADYQAASSNYEKVLKREPKNRDALLGMAAVAVKGEDYKKAKASYQLLLKLNPRDQVAMSAITNIDKLSSNSASESQLKFMLQQQPDATHLNFALGNFYAKQARWPEAQSEYFKAWQGNSKNADYAYNLAVSLDQIGKQKEALRFYNDCLALAINQNISFSKEVVEKRIQRISAK